MVQEVEGSDHVITYSLMICAVDYSISVL